MSPEQGSQSVGVHQESPLKNKINWRTVAVGGAVAVGLVSPLLYNFDTVSRVWQYLTTGNPVDCSVHEVSDTLASFYRTVTAIAVPGAGLYQDEATGRYVPSTFERRRLDATALLYIQMYKQNLRPRIKLLDGVKASVVDPNVDGEYLRKQIEVFSDGQVTLSPWDIEVDSVSTNTWSNGLALSKLAQGNVIVVDDGYHSLRTGLYFCEQGNQVRMMTVESIYAMYHPEGLSAILEEDKSFGMTFRRLKESAEIMAFIWDKKNDLGNWAKAITTPAITKK